LRPAIVVQDDDPIAPTGGAVMVDRLQLSALEELGQAPARFEMLPAQGEEPVDDRALAHLQMVVANKLRRGEPFFFTWKDDPSIGHGRTAVWVHPACNMVFTYHGGRRPPLNRIWIEALSQLANTPAGLRLIPEPSQVDEMQLDDGSHLP
jgi:hypothetical protein